MKKNSASWNIAATHWLTSGFVVPLILSFVIIFILKIIFGKDIESGATLIAFASIIYLPVVYWLGVMYSARYVNKKYFIESSNEIAKLATIYLIIVGGGLRLLQTINGSGLIMDNIGFILAVIVFYIASKKYIKNSNEQSSTTPTSGSL